MSVNKLNVTRIRNVKLPTRATPGSAGIDLYVPFDLTRVDMNKMIDMNKTNVRVDVSPTNGYVTSVIIGPGESCTIPTGLKVCVPDGYMLKIENKSSIAMLKHLQVGACVVDSDYQGEILIHFHNVSNDTYGQNGRKAALLEPGMKMCQAVLVPVETPEIVEVETVTELFKGKKSERNEGGFGSTGK